MGTLNSRNKGFSLVELMVALVLSLFLIAGLFYSVLGDMKAYDSTRGTQGLITKSRMSIQYLKLYLQQAGYRDIEQLKGSVNFVEKVDWSEGQILRGFNAVTAGQVTGATDPKLDSDIAVIRFLGSANGIFDCAGNEVIDVVSEYELSLYVNTNGDLICDNGTTQEVLDEGIDNLHILYGISDNNSYQYFTATEIETNNAWTTVNRLKVALLVSQEVQANDHNNSQIYTLFDRAISAANDTNYRKTVRETVLIRNQGG